MQLIFEAQPTEGIKTNMSTQAEKSTNEDFSDIKRTNINHIDGGTVADPEICLNNQIETKIDQVKSETITESVLKENCLGNKNGKENKKCNQEALETIKKSDLIESIKSILDENITNGTSSSKDDVQSECDNVHEKIATDNILLKNKVVDPEINTSTTKENVESLIENDDALNNQHSELELSLSDDTTNCLSKDVEPEETSKIHTDDAGSKVKKNGSSSNDKEETMDVIVTTVVNNIETEDVTISDVGTDRDAGENGNKILTNDTTCPVHKNELVDIPENDQVITPDSNLLVNKDHSLQSKTEVPTSILEISTEAVTLSDETIVENETLAIYGVKDSEDITMSDDIDNSQAINNKTENYSEVVSIDNDIHKQSEVHVDNVVHNKADTETFETIVEDDTLAAIDIDPPEDVIMQEEIDKLPEVPANTAINDETTTKLEIITSQQDKLPTNDIHSDAVVIDEDMNKTSQITLNIVSNSKSDTLTDESVLELKKISTINEKNIEDISIVEEIDKNEVPENVAINNETNAPRIDKKVEDVLIIETNITRIDNNEKRYTTLKNTEKPQPVSIENDKLVPCAKECVPVQNENTSPKQDGSNLKILPRKEKTNDILKAVRAAMPIDKITISDNIEQVSDTFLENNLETLKANNESAMSTTNFFENEDDDNDVEHVPMEIDEIEIVDSDKDSQDENSMSMIFTDKVDSNETNVIEGDPEITITEPLTNNDVDAEKTEAENKTKNANLVPIGNESNELTKDDQEKVEIFDEDDLKIVENKTDEMSTKTSNKEKSPERKPTKTLPVVCKLSNTLDILSDDEDEPSTQETTAANNSSTDKQCINIDDDDDIMLIEEDVNSKDKPNGDTTEVFNDKEETQPQPNNEINLKIAEKETITTHNMELSPKINEKDLSPLALDSIPTVQNISEEEVVKPDKKPLLPQNFLKTAKKNLADMTRDDLEDFCVLRIVESIVDRTNLSDVKTKMKTMAQNLEDFRKRALMLTKQNRDLQVVLKSVQEEQKKRINAPIQPLKITRSVGMQVLMNEKAEARRKGPIPYQPPSALAPRPNRPVPVQKVMKPPVVPPTPIPVPRKVPVSNTPIKIHTSTPMNNVAKVTSPSPALRLPSPVQKAPEKRTYSRMQATQGSPTVTVDLTDDEPPPKLINKSSPVAPVRVVSSQNLLPQPRAFTQPLNSPRKVYIPISGPQGHTIQAIRPGQTLMMKSVQLTGSRPRGPALPRIPQAPVRIVKTLNTHPAPLPDTIKQYSQPTWKALPPAPDLKLSKVENGIVISWKIEEDPDSYEAVVSYQLYAYQETPTPPSTALWKKIGDVKALPLPMACTLTQFMAGFKYYFAVRAVDIRSRLGAFSKPGNILLLNKV